MSYHDSEVARSNKFPGKLWRLVNSCRSGAIGWGQGGHTIIIHQAKFQKEYLDEPNNLFKTTNIGSFIRQLNLYGFRKLNALRYSENGSEIREVHEFQNDYFIRGRAELLPNLRRNVGIRRSREMAVKRRLEALQSFAAKRPRSIQDLNSVVCGGRGYPGAKHGVSIKPTSVIANGKPPPITMQATQTGDWPMYMQWDGSSYKYVVLPDASTPPAAESARGPLQQVPLTSHILMTTPQQRVITSQPIMRVPELPPTSAQEYYLIHLPPEETESVSDDSEGSSCPSEYKLQSLLTKPQNGFSFIRTDTRQAISPTPGQTVQEEMQISPPCETAGQGPVFHLTSPITITQEQYERSGLVAPMSPEAAAVTQSPMPPTVALPPPPHLRMMRSPVAQHSPALATLHSPPPLHPLKSTPPEFASPCTHRIPPMNTQRPAAMSPPPTLASYQYVMDCRSQGSEPASPMLQRARATLVTSATGLTSPMSEVTSILRAAALSTAASAKMKPPPVEGEDDQTSSIPPVLGYDAIEEVDKSELDVYIQGGGQVDSEDLVPFSLPPLAPRLRLQSEESTISEDPEESQPEESLDCVYLDDIASRQRHARVKVEMIEQVTMA